MLEGRGCCLGPEFGYLQMLRMGKGRYFCAILFRVITAGCLLMLYFIYKFLDGTSPGVKFECERSILGLCMGVVVGG